MILLRIKVIGFELFRKLVIFVEIPNILKNEKMEKYAQEGAPALRFTRVGTGLTVHRSLH